MIVAVCVSSEGCIHPRTMEACLLNLKQAEVDWLPCFEYGKPSPEAQNSVTAKALASDVEWLWYLGEDIVPNPNALRAMLPEARVITAKYKNVDGSWAYELDDQGRVKSVGLGCLLVHRSVFSRLKVPYFGGIRSDVYFFGQLWQSGIEARLANTTCERA